MEGNKNLMAVIEPNAACDIIMEGGTPRSVAFRYPLWFVENHLGLIMLWETVNRRQWKWRE